MEMKMPTCTLCNKREIDKDCRVYLKVVKTEDEAYLGVEREACLCKVCYDERFKK